MKEEDARLRREIEQITQRAQEIDAAEDTEFGRTFAAMSSPRTAAPGDAARRS